MRVPVIDAPSVATSERAGYQPQLRNADTSLEQGLQSLGRGIETVVAATETYVAKADELRRTEALTQYQKDITAELQGDSSTQGKVDAAFDGRPAPTGFLNVKGTEASAQSAELLQRLEKRRQELGATLNDRQRAGFLERSAGAYEGARGRIEAHVGQQFRAAQVATLDAAKQTYLDAVASGSADPVDLERMRADVEKSIAALSLSPEDAKADIAKLRGDAAVGAISAALANEDVDTASQQLEAHRAELGTRYPQVKHQVDVARKGRDQDLSQGEADKQVAAWAEEVRSKEGFVTEQDLKARAKGNIPIERQRFFEHALDRRVRDEERRYEARKDEARKAVKQAILDDHPLPGALRDFLYNHDQDTLIAFDARQKRKDEHERALRNGTPSQRTAAAKQQTDDDEAFRYRVQWRMREDPSLTVDAIETEFIAETKRKYGRDAAISRPEMERARAFSVDFQQKVGTKEGAADKTNGARVEKAVVAAIKRGLAKGEKVDPAALNDEVGRDMYLLQARIEANGGKPLNELQWSEFEEEITRELTIDKPGRVYGTNTVNVGRAGQQPVYGPAAPPASSVPTQSTTKRPTATGKNGEKYQLSEDGKSWEPIK